MIEFPFHCPNKTKDCSDLTATMMHHDDFSEVQAIIHRIFADSTPIERSYWEKLLQNYPTFILRKNTKIVGFSSVQPKHHKKDFFTNINLIGVLPEYRRNGYGKILLELSETFGKRVGSTAIRLHTEQRKPENVSFYSKNDFRVIELIPDYYGSRGDGVYMEKIVTSSVFKPIKKRAKSRRRGPRKERGNKCAHIFGEFPTSIMCENLSDVLPHFSKINAYLSEASSIDELNCLNRQINKISGKCRRNKLIKPTVLSMKRAINREVKHTTFLIKNNLI